MKKGFAVYLTIVLATLLAACADGGRVYKIGVSQCSEGHWRDKVNQEMLAAQHLYEHDAQVVIAQAHDDTELQIRQIDSLAQSGIDLLVVAPNEAAPIAGAIARVRQKGIPVIFFDRKATTDDYTAFIGGNNVKAGRTVAEGVLGDTQRPFVLEITGAMSTSPAQERHKGFAEVMQQHPELTYVCREGDWTSDKAYRIAMEYLSKGDSAGTLPPRGGQAWLTIFCHNDGMATGVYKAVVETGTEGRVKIFGIDGMPGEGLEYVQFGHQVGTYIYPTHGEEVVRLALNILTGQPYKRDNELRGTMVTPDNVDLVAAVSTELMKQNGDLVTVQDKLEEYLGLYSTQRKVLVASLVAIVLLVVAVLMMWRANVQTRRAVRQRQALNEEETLFYTNPDSRTLRQVFKGSPQPPSAAGEDFGALPLQEGVRGRQDAIFAHTLNEAIRRHLSNPSLRMDDLGEQVGLSRVQLYRKVKAITGLSPVELLRQMRLQQGYVLLTTTNKTVQEVAFEVGFNTPAYFSKCFREQYGKYPTELRES